MISSNYHYFYNALGVCFRVFCVNPHKFAYILTIFASLNIVLIYVLVSYADPEAHMLKSISILPLHIFESGGFIPDK